MHPASAGNDPKPDQDIDEAIHITVPIGASSYFPCESIDDVIARADAALYEAKGSGKNMVVCKNTI